MAVGFRGNGKGGLGIEHSTDPDIWYVCYRTNITPRRGDGERRSVRATRKFKSEAEAKQFAQEMIKEGWSAIAGTLNQPVAQRIEEIRAEDEERSEQQVDRRANLRLLLAAFVQSASKLNTDFQSGSPNEATIEPSATIFGEEQGEMVR